MSGSMQIKTGDRAAMRMVLGPSGVNIMHRQLHITLGLAPRNRFALAAGWPRPKHCAQCGITCTTLYRCDRCVQRVLCGEECQRKDWRSGHKHVCISMDVRYEVRDFPGRPGAADAHFRDALLGPASTAVTAAVFATTAI